MTNADLKKRSKSSSVSSSSGRVIDAEETKRESKNSSEKKLNNHQPNLDILKEESTNIELLELKLEKADKLVGRLLQKMNDLWQKYSNPGDMTPKNRVQSEIARTYLMLQKAQHDAAEVKKEWEAAISKEDT